MYHNLKIKRMGKSKDPVLKAKCPDFKLLSVQFEQEAKIESEKKKIKNLKRRQELHEKMEIDFRNNRSGSDHSQRSFYDKPNNSLMESIYVVKNEVAERRQKKFDKVEKTVNVLREEKEDNQNSSLVREHFNYIYRDFHYFYKIPYEKKKLEITCFSDSASLTSPTQDMSILEEDYAKCYQNQILFSIKNLARYDCWEDKTIMELLEICTENTKDFDGVSPVFENNDYVWRQVKVLGYDEEKEKYKVIFLHSDQIKFVSRLSLLFFNENRPEFEYRKYLCEKRRTAVDEYILFTRYLDNIPEEIVSKLNPLWERKIFYFLKFVTKRLAAKYNYIFSNNNPPFIREIKTIRQDYLRQMKKCRIILEMAEEENEPKFEERSLKIRPLFAVIRTPITGINIGKKNQRDFAEKKRFLNQRSFFEDKYLSMVQVQFLKESEKLKKMKILLNEIEEDKLPMTSADFEKIKEKYNSTSEYNVTTQCMHTLRNLIMDGLGPIELDKKMTKKYDFYMVEPSHFPDSRIKRVLQYFNLILYNKIKELINISIDSFMKYIRRFSEFDDIKRIELKEPNIPLFITKIKVNGDITEEKKKSKSKKNEESNDPLVIFDPPLKDFQDKLLSSYTHIKDVVSKLLDLTALSIKVIELPHKKIFDLTDEYPIYKNGLIELNEIIEVGKKQAQEVKDRYNKFEKLLTQTPDNYVKNKIGEKTKNQTNLDIDECKKLLLFLYTMGKDIDESESEISLKMFRIQTDDIKVSIKEKIKTIVQTIV